MRLFEPIEINGVTVPNRIAKSAMAEGLCDPEGRPQAGLAEMYERWSAGGVGLSFTGMAHLRPGFSFTGHEIGLYDDSLIAPLREVTEAAHRHEGKLFAQLCHAPPQLPRAKARVLGAVAPSRAFNRTNLLVDRPLKDDEILAIIGDFGDAARRAREAGFDGVQLHGAHGYLISRFLSPATNRRRDRWGGSFEARLRFVQEIIGAIRSRVGADYPVTIKMNARDGLRGGLEVKEAVRLARCMEQMGFDAIEVSAGMGDVGLGHFPNKGEIAVEPSKEFLSENFAFLRPVMPLLGPFLRWSQRFVAFEQEAYFYPLARRIADAVAIPVMVVGGIRSLSTARRILRESRIAMVSLARPLVRQPSLPRAWQEGRKQRASCTSCNRCFAFIGLERPLRCRAVRT